MHSHQKGQLGRSINDKSLRHSLPDPHDLAFFMKQLLPVTRNWMDLGLELGLTLKELKAIESMPLLISGGPTTFLREMLHGWLNRAPPSHPFPTITKLCDALRSCTVREERVAYDIEQQYQAQRKGLPALQLNQHSTVCNSEPVSHTWDWHTWNSPFKPSSAVIELKYTFVFMQHTIALLMRYRLELW